MLNVSPVELLFLLKHLMPIIAYCIRHALWQPCAAGFSKTAYGKKHAAVRRKRPQHLIYRNFINYLRSYVVWCSTEGLGGDSVIHIFFTHAKVCYLNVTLTVQHHIVQLQVSTGRRKTLRKASLFVNNSHQWIAVAEA